MSDDHLSEYRHKLGQRQFTSLTGLQTGELIQFKHHNNERIGLLLAANYKDKLHVISLKEIPFQNYTEMIQQINPMPLSPQELYGRVRNLSLDFGAYRQYLLKDISQVQRILPKKKNKP